MSNTVIKVENLSKKYIIGHQVKGGYTALRDVVAEKVSRSWNRLTGRPVPPDPSLEEFWALKDVNFEVKQGDRVGIIGRNGAGKSTLLKILSRITEPTKGMVKIKGRMASLLEVGTGFHAELTGRENIFLNGAILGMKQTEIKKKFDEIVAFAEVEKFLDTPVKRYSSGMYVRLAFAVAAHLEPELLVVDEVLAVGDALFQKKCLGKMAEIGKEGRTVLFVSHNMQAIKSLCSRAVLLSNGRISADGDVSSITRSYLQNIPQANDMTELKEMIATLPQDVVLRFIDVNISQNGVPCNIIFNGLPLVISIEYEVMESTTGLRVYFDLCDGDDNILFRSFNDENGEGISKVACGRYLSQAIIPGDLLSPMDYDLRIRGTIYNVRACQPSDGIRVKLVVERTGNANKAYLAEPLRGKLSPIIPWATKTINH